MTFETIVLRYGYGKGQIIVEPDEYAEIMTFRAQHMPTDTSSIRWDFKSHGYPLLLGRQLVCSVFT